MITEVIKKDGTKVPFSLEKIKSAIMSAGSATDLSDERKLEVATQVIDNFLSETEGKTALSTTDIKSSILAQLDSIEPSISTAWRQYDQENK